MTVLSECITDFVCFKKAQCLSPATIQDYECILRKFMKSLGDVPMETIRAKQVVQYLASLAVSKKRVKNIHVALSSFWKWGVLDGVAKENIIEQIKAPRADKHPMKPFTRDQVVQMLKATEYSELYERENKAACQNKLLNGERDRAIILLLVDTGIRASELCYVKVESLTSDGLYVRGKGSKDRIVPLSDAVRRVLEPFLQKGPDDYIFLSNRGNPLNRDCLRLIIKRLGQRAGVPNAHPHRFRHTFALNFLRNHGNPFALQLILGHETLDMVKRYLALAQADVQRAHRIASPVEGWELIEETVFDS